MNNMIKIVRLWTHTSRTGMLPLCAAVSVSVVAAQAGGGVQHQGKAAAETVIYSFQGQPDGEYPYGNLIDVKGTVYGTTEIGGTSNYCCGSGGGTVFAVDMSSGSEKIVYSFCSQQNCADGLFPNAGVINENGKFYGTTANGGTGNCSNIDNDGCGTIFTLDQNTGVEKVLYSFCSRKNCHDGAFPVTGLLDVNGMLYGTTGNGGTNGVNEGGDGTVFRLDPKTGTETVLYSFCSLKSCSDGSLPSSGLIEVNGTFFGTTWQGGGAKCPYGGGCGTVFSLDPDTGAEKVIHAFQDNGSDGWDPASLIYANGTLYGTTVYGGGTGCESHKIGYGCGTVFSLDTNTGTETVLYSFSGGKDGAFPYANLTESNDKLYGTALQGGANCRRSGGCGTVFSVDPRTGVEKVLHSFCSEEACADGDEPGSGLIDIRGSLYGVTSSGGTGYCYDIYGEVSCGTVYSVKP